MDATNPIDAVAMDPAESADYDQLDHALRDSFPASDPPSIGRAARIGRPAGQATISPRSAGAGS